MNASDIWTGTEFAAEQGRRLSAKERVLYALEAAGDRGVLNIVLTSPTLGGIRAGSRVQELRDEGYAITCDPVEGQRGIYRYTLRARPVIAPSNVTTAVERWPVKEPDARPGMLF